MVRRLSVPVTVSLLAAVPPLAAAALVGVAPPKSGAPVRPVATAPTEAFLRENCLDCHSPSGKKGGLDIAALLSAPPTGDTMRRWIRIHDRVRAGEMPPRSYPDPPSPAARAAFLKQMAASLTARERDATIREGRATQRRLNGYEYENALRDLLQAPWLQVKDQFPPDGEAYRFNKIGDALDVSHVHVSRYMAAADYAIRQALSVRLSRPATRTTRHYARDQKTLTSKFTQNPFNTSPDRQTYPVLGTAAQPEVRRRDAPLTVGDSDPATREKEAVGWVSSNYVTGFTYRWDGFRAPVAGRYRVRFSGYTLWAAPGGRQRRFASGSDKVGKEGDPRPNVPDYDAISPGRTTEPITVYTRNGLMNRRVGAFDVTPTPGVYDIGDVWLLAGETLVPDASRFYRSRPPNFRNPLMGKDGCPSVAFRWMEVEGPLYDDATTAGYRLLFGDLPLAKAAMGAPGVSVPVVSATGAGVEEVSVAVASQNPRADAERLLRAFLPKAYRRPVAEADVQRFLHLVESQRAAGLGFTEAMIAGYTAVLASPEFVYLNEKPGRLDDNALATRLALFLTNSVPDDRLRQRAARGELRRPEVLRAETERLLADPKSSRFVDAFLDYWLDLRKIEDSTPSTTLYNDYYLDDALTEASLLESRLFFTDLLQRDLPALNLVDSRFTFLNERLARHYGVPGVRGSAMRRVVLPPDSPRGGFLTQASVLKVTANGTTTSPVLRGKWVLERILGDEVPPPPPVPAVEPDIRGAVTIRQQLEKHRSDKSCATCHTRMDPPGFALESFDVMGGWRDRYRGVSEDKPPVPGYGKNGNAYSFHYALPVDSAGALPDGRPFTDIRDFKRLLRTEETTVARNLAQQLVVYATGAPIRFGDRGAIDQIVQRSKLARAGTGSSGKFGVRRMIHEIVQSDLFRNK
jgi:mono/diheme cytochrome c family protein